MYIMGSTGGFQDCSCSADNHSNAPSDKRRFRPSRLQPVGSANGAGAVGRSRIAATAKSLAAAGHLSTASSQTSRDEKFLTVPPPGTLSRILLTSPPFGRPAWPAGSAARPAPIRHRSRRGITQATSISRAAVLGFPHRTPPPNQARSITNHSRFIRLNNFPVRFWEPIQKVGIQAE
jgi:hypothetical protein